MKNCSILIIGTFLYDNSTPFPQAKLLSDLLEAEGYKTKCISNKKNQFLRLIDICYNIIISPHDYIFVQIFSGPAFIYAALAILLGRMKKKRIIGVLRGGNLPVYLTKRKKIKLWILRQAHTLIAPSGYLQNELSKLKIETDVIPNIINLKRYDFRHRSQVTPKILWIRRYIDIYNPQMVIKVAQILKTQNNDFKLTMAGGGDSSLIQEEIVQKGLEDNVTIMGFITKKQINTLGKQHDIFLNTANIDNFPVTVIEAMAMGLIVVSTDVGGIPFFLENNSNALLIKKNDHEDMAKAIIKLCDDSDLCTKLCESSHKTVSGYSWNSIRKKYIEIFQ